MKPHSFCETPEENCTMNYCDENGCLNRKRELIDDHIVDPNEMVSSQTDEKGQSLTYWGGLADDAFERESAINKLAEDDELQFIKKQLENIEHYKLGYNAAQRKLYTKEEMELCWIAAMSNRAGFSDSISYKEFIQSLKKD